MFPSVLVTYFFSVYIWKDVGTALNSREEFLACNEQFHIIMSHYHYTLQIMGVNITVLVSQKIPK